MLLYLMILAALIPFYLILKCVANHYSFVEAVYIRIRDTLFWNYPLRYIMETYLALTFFAFTQIFTEGLVWDSGFMIVSSLFALLCAIIFIVIPIPMTWFFRKNCRNFYNFFDCENLKLECSKPVCFKIIIYVSCKCTSKRF